MIYPIVFLHLLCSVSIPQDCCIFCALFPYHKIAVSFVLCVHTTRLLHLLCSVSIPQDWCIFCALFPYHNIANTPFCTATYNWVTIPSLVHATYNCQAGLQHYGDTLYGPLIISSSLLSIIYFGKKSNSSGRVLLTHCVLFLHITTSTEEPPYVDQYSSMHNSLW